MSAGPSSSDRLAAETVLAAARAAGEGDLARRLERLTSPELRRLALELESLRERAAGRLWRAESLLLTAKGLEQASGADAAQWRAHTLRARDSEDLPLLDATAGLGLDAAALALDRRVVAQDRDPETAALCGVNLERLVGRRALAVCADALRPAARTPLVAIDPDRRPDGRRELDPERWSPRWSQVVALLAAAEGGVAKLPPAVDLERLAAALPPGLARSWSWVGRGRELVELTLWTGRLADPEAAVEALRLAPDAGVRALRDGGPAGDEPAPTGRVEARLAGAPEEPPPALSPERAAEVEWIAEPHAAVLRSGLATELARRIGAAPLGPRLGFLGPLAPGTAAPEAGPLLGVLAVVDGAPADPKRVRRMLAEHDVGEVRVRVRGHPDPPERLERRFRGKGTRRGRLLVARLERGHRAYLVEERSPTDLSRPAPRS